MKLSYEEIETILDVLHFDVQFYNSCGKHANRDILNEIRECLEKHFLKKKKQYNDKIRNAD
jgi:hypothetical protein